jgi:membrane fusion protein (multidrug efflux system)
MENNIKYGFKLLFLLVIILLSFNACKKGQQQSKEIASFETQVLSPQNRTLETKYSASIQGKQDVQLFPQVSGTIIKINVEEGSVVRKGSTLFIIDQIPFKSALNTARANLSAVKAQLANAQLNYNSKKELFNQHVVSEFDLKTSENELLLVKAQVEQMAAQVENAENNLSYTIIKSPSDGIVGILPYRKGALVSASMTTPLTTISDNSEMQVFFSMNENQLLSLTKQYGSIKNTMDSLPDVRLELSDGTFYKKTGRIKGISGLIDRNTGSVTLKAVFPNEDRLLFSGSTGNILLPVEYKNNLVVPQSATYELQDKWYVYKVIDGKAVATQISVSPVSNGQEFIVTEGLTSGDEIVTNGIANLEDGMQIK